MIGILRCPIRIYTLIDLRSIMLNVLLLLVALYSTKGKASESKTERGRLLVVLINSLHMSASHSINKSNFHAKDKL